MYRIGTATLVSACVAVLALLVSAAALTAARSGARDAPDRLTGSADLIAQVGGSTPVIRMDGDVAWMGTGPRVVAVDVSDPSAPRVLGRSELMPGVVMDLAIPSVEPNGAGARSDVAWAFVAGSAGHWVVSVDISQPWAPTYVGSVQVERAMWIAAIDDHVWLATLDGAVVAIDARDPATPVLVSSTPVVAGRVEIPAVGAVDGHLLIATGVGDTDGDILLVLDVRDPTTPSVVGKLIHPGIDHWSIRDMAVADGMAWLLAGYPTELAAVDLTDPTFPIVAGRHLDLRGMGFELAVADGKAFLVGGDWGHNWVTADVIDVSDPTAMRTQDAGHHVESLNTNPSGGMAVRDGVLWMGVGDGRVMSVDASDPVVEPEESGAVQNPGPVFEIALTGKHLLGALHEAVVVIDVREAAAPKQITQTLVHRYPESIAVDGDLAVVSVGGAMDQIYSAVETVDVRDPTQPEELAELMTAGQGRADVSDGVVAVCEGAWVDDDGNLAFYDVSDPNQPTRLSEFGLPHGCWDVALRDRIVYALAPDWRGEHDFRLHLVSTVDAERPLALGVVRLDDPPERWHAVSRLALGERHVYVTTAGTSDEPELRVSPKLHVVDVSDPTAPTRVALVDLPSAAYSVAYDDGYVFLAMYGGVRIMDVRDPANPRDVITLPVHVGAEDVVAADGLVYVAAGGGGIYVFAPQLPGWEPWVATPTATATAGDSPTPTPTRTRETPTPYPLTLTPDLLTATPTPDPLPIRIYSPLAQR